jgi:DNA-binding beta-propeller fold protein YncE
MSGTFGLAWRGRRRSRARVLVLFAVTAGAYWPVWLAQVVPGSGDARPAARRRLAILAAALIPGINVVLEIALALLLPRAVRRLAESEPQPVATDSETQTFLLLAAPFAAIALALVLGLPAWLVGYLAWPLELPAALVIQRTLNKLDARPEAPLRGTDGEVAVCAGIAAAIAVGVVLAIALSGGSTNKGKPTVSGPPPETVSDVVGAPDGIWITRILDNAVAQIDPATLRPTGKRVRVGKSPYDIAYGFGSLWTADYRNDAVSRVDTRASPPRSRLIHTGRGPFGVAVGYGGVWVTNEVDRNVVEIDPRRNQVRKIITVGPGPRGVDVGLGAVWVAGAGSSSVIRVDPRSGATRGIPVPDLAQDVAVGAGSVWAAIPRANAVVRIDPNRGRRTGGLIGVGLGPASIDYGGGKVWVANGGDGTVTRIDAHTGKVVGKPIRVGKQLVDLSVSGRNVLVLRSDGVVRRLPLR